MSTRGDVIVRNGAAMIIAQLVTLALTVLLTVLVSRYLGPAGIGKLRLATSLWTLGAILTAAGTDVLFLKESVRSSSRVYDVFLTAAVLRVAIGTLVFGIILALSRASRYEPDVLALILLLGIAMLVTDLGNLSRAVLQGLDQVRGLALGSVASKLFATVASAALLMRGLGLSALAAVSIISAVIYTLIPLRDVMRLGRVSPRLRPCEAWPILRSGLPYLAAALFLAGYGQVDVIVLSLLASDAELGWYSAAVQFLSTLSFVPVVAGAVLLPTLVRAHAEAPRHVPGLIGRAFGLMAVVAIPIGVGLFVLSESAIQIVYGSSFAPSVPVLALVGVVVVLTYENTLVGYCLVAMDRQLLRTWSAALALLATIPLDLICIPWSQRTFGNGAIGGAITYIVTEGAVLVAYASALPAGTLTWDVVGRIMRASIAGMLMAVAMWPVRHMFFLVPITVGLAIYAGLTSLFRVLTPEDWRMFVRAWHVLLVRRGQPALSAATGPA